jgi:antiviral helicase SKI2
MILNLLRVNDLSVEDMIKRSFSEFHTQRALAGNNLKAKLREKEAKLDVLIEEQNQDGCILGEISEIEYYVKSINSIQISIFEQLKIIHMNKSQELSNILCPGRVICIQKDEIICPIEGVLITEPFVDKEAITGTTSRGSSTKGARSSLMLSHDLSGLSIYLCNYNTIS